MTTINIIDVTVRDGQQCLWATRMTTAMMLPIVKRMDDIGYEMIDLVGGAAFESCVRYLREDPWERCRLVRERVTRTPLNMIMRGQSLFTWEVFPDDVVELTMKRAAANGIRRMILMDPLIDVRNLEVSNTAAQAEGIFTIGAIPFTLSPVHTDEFFAEAARQMVALGMDAIQLKDQSGLLTPDRVRTLVPALKAAIGSVPLHMHSHCMTGLAPLCYLEAIQRGVTTIHTAVRPLANGASLPCTETVVENVRRMGFEVPLDDVGVKEQSDYFGWVAKCEKKPTGQVAELDLFHYEHHMPGGMISNLRSQLGTYGLGDRLGEVLEELKRVREDLGYPVIVSPFAQYFVTQALLNVLHGERYKMVPDEVRKYALGHYGKLASPVEPNVLDRIAKKEKPVTVRAGALLPPAVERFRTQRGPFRSDDDMLLAMFWPKEHVDAVFAARPMNTEYRASPDPMETLIKELTMRTDLAYLNIQHPGFALTEKF